MTNTLPKKLKVDAILEAVLEIRFEPDPSLVPEILFGRFADVDEWKSFRQARLPGADIPAQIRRSDTKFKYLPSIDLTSPDGETSVRIGPQVIVYSRRGNYPGWAQFGAELENVASHLYRLIPNVQVSRLGLRYVNALESGNHGIRSIDDMDINIMVADGALIAGINLNFKSNIGTDFETVSRISSVDMAQGSIPEHATVIIDIDVYTHQGYSSTDAESVKRWVVEAHDAEKKNFFMILGHEVTERLRED